jgi:hypothetical protein
MGTLFSLLHFKVFLALENIPAQVKSLDTAQLVVGSSCLIFDTAPSLADGSDMSHFLAVAWAVHPDLISTEVRCMFLELEQPFLERAPPLFLSASEIIHAKQGTLQLRVFIMIVEILDFTIPLDSDDDQSDSNKDSANDGIPGPSPSLSTLLRPWPKVYRLPSVTCGHRSQATVGA